VSVEDLPPSPAGSPVDVVFDLDLSGVLHVSAAHRPSGREASIAIKHGPTRLTDQRRESSRARVEKLRSEGGQGTESPAEKGKGETRLARSLLRRAERALSGEIPPALRTRLEEAKARLERVHAEEDDATEAVEALADLLYELD